MIKKTLEKIWAILISLRLAVLLLVALALSLMAATFIESGYDSKTAQYFIYRAAWFYALLTTLGVNILAVAISRYPWKPKHAPFLCAHVGILMLLTGSWLTYVKGVDGNLRLTEGEVGSSIELDQHIVALSETDPASGRPEAIHSFPLAWMPPMIAERFQPIALKDYGLQIDRYLSDAESKVTFQPATESAQKTGSAVQFKILGSPMGGAPEIWLWSGESGWAMQKLGLARFLIRREDQKELAAPAPETGAAPEARFDFVVTASGKLKYETLSIRGEKKTGEINLNAGALNSGEPQILDPGWRMPIKIQFKKFIPRATLHTDFLPITEKAGMSGALPMPAIHLSVMGAKAEDPSSSLWLGLGDRAELTRANGSKVSVGYFSKLITLPFALRLKQFEVQHDPGTNNPAAYVSHVQTVEALQKTEQQMDQLPVHAISMNEPLNVQHYTFYQASFIPDFPRPTTTILSVNYDPGRQLKYWGSLLIVFGSILLFTLKSFGRKKVAVT